MWFAFAPISEPPNRLFLPGMHTHIVQILYIAQPQQFVTLQGLAILFEQDPSLQARPVHPVVYPKA
jgi:hypothetical protein